MLNRLESYLIQIIKGDKKGIRAKIVLFFLSLMELIYLVIIKIRNKLYQFNWFKSKKIEATVISIGNITGGGTGKTPLVDKVAKELNKFEKNIAVLSRGYQGENEKPKIVKENKNFKKSIEKYGDEALMLNRQLSGIPIIIGKKRYESGKKAVNSLNTKIIILDDGFQHRQLDRDLDILIIDALNPFGYNHLIPRGFLREPLSALKRADIFLISRSNRVTDNKLQKIRQKLKQYNNIPVYYMNYRPLNFQFLNSDLSHLKTIPLKQLESEEVLAVSGIGNPEGFIKTLKDLSLKVKDSLHFADHYQYGKDGINHIIDLCKKNKVDKVIITEKDGVKFTPEIMDTLDKAGIKIYCLKISVEINREREFFSHIKPIS